MLASGRAQARDAAVNVALSFSDGLACGDACSCPLNQSVLHLLTAAAGEHCDAHGLTCRRAATACGHCGGEQLVCLSRLVTWRASFVLRPNSFEQSPRVHRCHREVGAIQLHNRCACPNVSLFPHTSLDPPDPPSHSFFTHETSCCEAVASLGCSCGTVDARS